MVATATAERKKSSETKLEIYKLTSHSIRPCPWLDWTRIQVNNSQWPYILTYPRLIAGAYISADLIKGITKSVQHIEQDDASARSPSISIHPLAATQSVLAVDSTLARLALSPLFSQRDRKRPPGINQSS